MTLKGQDILDGAQFTREELERMMNVADEFRTRLQRAPSLDLLSGYVLATLFFEPSTRTRLSFETAMHRLGGRVIGFSSAESSSVAKGETLEDTVRTVDQYADIIVIRHPQMGSAKVAAEVAEHPVINGGDGAGQHPTQALLDLYTIRAERGRVDGLTIALCGDLKYGRTVHSGVWVYRHYNCRLMLVSPEALRMPPDIVAALRAQGVQVEETTDLEAALAQADVLYMTRIQKERFADPAEYERLRGSYILTREMIERINPSVTILHPLPRVDEIAPEVDGLPNAAYFRQARNGVYVRMALLALVLGRVGEGVWI
ncbi:MAG: aspartate carbamoyltransferase [Anaerolineae bacterium]|nr:aspartate carbamoyltransferase [Anaerolineae bacterium]MDW8067877.1 aspartate carbamoyltransferase [Anaerolineae bacterium]